MSIQKLLGAATTVGFVLVASPALAMTTVTGTNTGTGAGSLNTNTHSVVNVPTFTASMNAFLTNPLFVNATSGGNVLSGNTMSGGLTTLPMNVTGTFVSNVNQTPIVMPVMPSMDVTGMFGNATTGAGSVNQNSLNVTNVSNTSVTKTATVINPMTLNLSSGGNVITGNTSVGPAIVGGGSVNISSIANAN